MTGFGPRRSRQISMPTSEVGHQRIARRGNGEDQDYFLLVKGREIFDVSKDEVVPVMEDRSGVRQGFKIVAYSDGNITVVKTKSR